MHNNSAFFQSKKADTPQIKHNNVTSSASLFSNLSQLNFLVVHCLWKEILSQQRIRHFKIFGWRI